MQFESCSVYIPRGYGMGYVDDPGVRSYACDYALHHPDVRIMCAEVSQQGNRCSQERLPGCNSSGGAGVGQTEISSGD